MLKHGFLILAHNNLELLSNIIKLLETPNHYFFINIDKKNKLGENYIKNFKSKYQNIFFLKEKERVDIAHGGYSMIKAELKLLKLAYNQGMDYVHLISGQDFPCKSNKEFDKFFEDNNGRSYMHFDSEEEGLEWSKNKYPARIKYYYFKDIPRRDIFIFDFFAKGLTKISKLLPIRKEIKGLWAGWQWFSWHRNVCKYVLEQEKHNKKFFKRFKFTSCSDEVLFITLLKPVTSQLNIDINNSLRYIDWHSEKPNRSSSGRRPLILNEEEYEDIIKSGAFFCRKIDPIISEKLIQMLEKNIIS